MLSYRHSYHAGNFADVIKHIVLVETLDHMIKKESTFEYIDTHSGSGLFDLTSLESTKLGEHVDGIQKLHSESFPEISRYFEVIESINPTSPINFYPGSPLIAKYFLRPIDRAWLYELHPQDHKILNQNMGGNKKIRIFNTDGLKGLLGLLPPTSRRALVLIDPSYEIKTDYDHVCDTLLSAYKKFNTGVYAVWYPVVERNRVTKMEKQLINSGIKNIQRFELGITEDADGRGMTSSGMFIINPPWTLYKKMSDLLPKLAKALSHNNELFYKCDILVGE